MDRRIALAACPSLLAASAWAQGGPKVQLAGTMGGKAMLVIDGKSQVLAVGQSAGGVTLRSVQGDAALIDTPGGPVTLRVGATPVVVGTSAPRASSGREIVLTAGPGGHFVTGGAINGQAVTFLVDTGATTVALSQAEAARIRLDLRNGRRGMGSTANGVVPMVALTLGSVRVGEVEVANVEASVLPAQMEHVLLGNSFLQRFQMRRDNDVLRLQLR